MNPSFTVLRDVNESMRSLLQSKVAELANPNAIVYDSPANITPSGSPKLSLFLYKVRYNKELRNTPPERISVVQEQKTPLHMDLLYLLTPLSNDNETQLIIMEKVVQALHDTAVLKGVLLKGQLIANGNPELRIVPDDLSLSEIFSLWQVFPNKDYRLAVTYCVTPVRVPSSRIEGITRVIQKTVNITTTED